MDHALVEKYNAQVPRYTSYPTAPHFNDEVSEDHYAQWLTEVPDDNPLSLYLHIPFCKEMCWYCGCFTKIVNKYEPVSAYVDTLLAEVDLVSQHMQHSGKVEHIHWGGGSPTILSPDDWRRTLDKLHSAFNVVDDVEVAVEMDPRTSTPDYVAALAQCGVNRVSIGVQDFDDQVQKAINRVQPYDVTRAVVDWLRTAGINNLNLDLMYGLPFQTREKIIDMTVKALSMEPSRVALFGYAHVPWMKAHQRLIPEEALPNSEERLAQAALAAEILKGAGYVRVGFDHFAHPDDPMAQTDGAVRRNFQGYTTDDASQLIGFGASAIGSLTQGYVQNNPSMKSYARSIAEGHLPISRGYVLSEEDRVRRAIIEQLMCELDANVGDICAAHGWDETAMDADLDSLVPMADDGLVELNGRNVHVTEVGRPLLRTVASAFDAFLASGKARHSAAV